MRNTTIFFLASMFTSLTTIAQIDWNNTRDGENIEYCKQHKNLAELMQNPSFVQQYEKDQAVLKNVEQQLKESTQATRTIHYIPVVFHVIHVGGKENISDEQIHDAMRVLNRDFRLQNADANNVQTEFNASNPDRVAQPADIEIEFRLATKAPDGTCFSGITRTFSTATNNGDGQVQIAAVVQGNDVYRGEWPGDKYLNVFVVNDANGAAGYTNYPSTWIGAGMRNGIWALHNYVGSIGTSNTSTSRTLTHEVGHWLNLPHVWGSTNNPGLASNCDTDDGVDDTPNTIGVTSCKLNENSCGSKANVENYMDYSYCSKMFTEGQRDRMRAALNASVGGRNNLIKASNLVATGADGNLQLCHADFEVLNTKICVGSSIEFKDKSFNNVLTRKWEFEGGTPATSTDKYPVITYATPGAYKVKLTVQNEDDSLTVTKEDYIIVQEGITNLPFYEGFENFDETNYQIFNGDTNSEKWEVVNDIAASGNKSLGLNNYKQNGDKDIFISPTIDLSTIENDKVTLSFKYAAAKRSNSQKSETLQVLISKDCGENYVLRKTLNGTILTTTIQASNWMPSEEDWKTVHVTNITKSYFTRDFRFQISYESNGGNNVYLDDINLYRGNPSDEVVLATTEVEKSIQNVSLYPNPTQEDLTVSFNAPKAENYTVQILDINGKIVEQFFIQATEGINDVYIETESLMNGMYFIQVANANTSETLKFVKQ